MKVKGLFFALFFLAFLLLAPSSYASVKTFKVISVIDGDTIKADIRGKTETIRLLAIDAPEMTNGKMQCYGNEAYQKLKSYVLGKEVILVDDSTQGNRDSYKRLLRYVYLPNSVRTFINGELVKQGYAYSYRKYSTKLLTKFNNLEKYAISNNLGLWKSCQITPTPKAVNNAVKNTIQQTNTQKSNVVAPSSNVGFTCSGKTTCGQMSSCSEAYFYLSNCGVSRLDGDKDGVPCESLCN